MKIEVINGDIKTLEGWAREASTFRDSVLDIARVLNRPFSGCGVFAFAELETGTPLEAPVIYHVMTEYIGEQHEIQKQKNNFLAFLRALSIATRAVGAVSHMETWFAVVEEGADRDPRPVSQRPDRREGIFVAFDHTDFGINGWMSEIGHDNGARTYGPWSDCYDRVAGELCNVVPNAQFWIDVPHRFPDIQSRCRDLVLQSPQFEMLGKPTRAES